MEKVINFIWSKPLCHSQFQQFLHDIKVNMEMYYITTMWGGSAWNQFCSNFSRLQGKLSDTVWIADLAFLVDITKHLNALNISLQAQNAVVSELYSHIKAFKTKLQLFQRHLSQTESCTSNFTALRDVTIGSTCVKTKKYAEALTLLASDFNNCFQDFTAIEKEILLFTTPFSVYPDEAPKNLQLELMKLQCDNKYHSQLHHFSLVPFTSSWIKASFKKYKRLQRKYWACLAQHICVRRHSRLWT